MENQFFLNGGVPHPIQFETTTPQSHFSSMQTWHHHHHQLSSSSSSPMEIQQPAHESFYNNPTTTTTTDHHNLYFDSALSSIVSSPSASNSNNNNIIPQNENNFVIRELTGKLGTIGSSGEISPHNSLQPLVYNNIPSLGNNNNHLVNENNNIKPIALNSSVAEFSADPGFAERAAKFSCFGSRSFNGRTSQIAANNAVAVAATAELTQRSTTVTAPFMENNGRISRVSSSPSLKTLGSQMVAMENKNNSPLQERIEASNSQDESTISEQAPNGETGLKPSPDMNSRKRKASSRGKPKEASIPSNPTKGVEGSEDSNAKRMKPNNDGGEGNENNNNGSVKVEEDSKGEEKQNNKSNNSKPPEPPKDYIHVRARRGQATDSHSLAERVRREKISERMKLLQDLVPGCNKVTGKALMLDEIINYVQSLQRQVEFLSMKLASVNTRMNLSIESLIPKDIFQSNHSLAHPINFPLDSSATPFYGHQTQQNPVIHNDIIPNGTVSHNSVDPLLDTSLCQNLGMQLPPLNGFNEVGSQYPLTFCEDDLHTIVQMGFGKTTNMKTPIQSPSFNGSNQVSQMKVEL